MKNFGISLLLALTVSVQGTSAFNYQDVQAKKRLIAQHQISNEMQEKRKRSFEIANTLLRRKGVPFDPEVLLQDHWQKTLAPVFAQMPEMQEVRYLDSLRGGVEIADSLYFPEKVPVLDDVIIIARHLVFEGKDVVIKGNHNVSIFPAEKVTIMGDKLPKQVSKKNEKEMVSVRIPNTRPPDKGGSITVDTSGIGYKDWLESIGGEAKLSPFPPGR